MQLRYRSRYIQRSRCDIYPIMQALPLPLCIWHPLMHQLAPRDARCRLIRCYRVVSSSEDDARGSSTSRMISEDTTSSAAIARHRSRLLSHDMATGVATPPCTTPYHLVVSDVVWCHMMKRHHLTHPRESGQAPSASAPRPYAQAAARAATWPGRRLRGPPAARAAGCAGRRSASVLGCPSARAGIEARGPACRYAPIPPSRQPPSPSLAGPPRADRVPPVPRPCRRAAAPCACPLSPPAPVSLPALRPACAGSRSPLVAGEREGRREKRLRRAREGRREKRLRRAPLLAPSVLLAPSLRPARLSSSLLSSRPSRSPLLGPGPSSCAP
jgi:hypothetical protein